ncbi:hypothetical protein NDU88_003913 [Pleurodeles waltl]|uniref:Uncharacterized protein n=1 Tax=Pleurodeles waltl TaxID=8319 RepID=A0AAV7V2Y0_PLEWA|nr:hypothetical protein NDU88_003913 [Pleurodeles waltl]
MKRLDKRPVAQGVLPSEGLSGPGPRSRSAGRQTEAPAAQSGLVDGGWVLSPLRHDSAGRPSRSRRRLSGLRGTGPVGHN